MTGIYRDKVDFSLLVAERAGCGNSPVCHGV
jgi:hypothetical protein